MPRSVCSAANSSSIENVPIFFDPARDPPNTDFSLIYSEMSCYIFQVIITIDTFLLHVELFRVKW